MQEAVIEGIQGLQARYCNLRPSRIEQYINKPAAKMSSLQLPDGIRYHVDKEHYGKTVDPTNTSHLTEGIMNGHLTLMMEEYKRLRLTGRRLWDTFKEDFEDFNLIALSAAHRNALRIFREYLLKNGVWVRSTKGISYAKAIHDCLMEEEPHEWDDERRAEVQALRSTEKQEQTTPSSPITITPKVFTTPGQARGTVQLGDPTQLRDSLRQPSPRPDPRPHDEQRTWHFDQPDRFDPDQLDHARRYRQDVQDRLNNRQQHPPQATNNAKMLTDLAKLYTDERRYGGDLYDVLDSKLRIFQDSCRKVGIEEGQYADAFSIMLKSRAATFYYDKLIGCSYDKMIHDIREHFETDEVKQQYLSEWRECTLSRVIAENPSLSKLECLNKLLDKLRTIQRGLDTSYHSDTSLRDQAINACRGIPECNLALFAPAKNYEGVCAQLRSAIGTAVRSQEAQQFTHASHDRPDFHDHNWTDRTYNGTTRRGGAKGGENNRPRGRGPNYPGKTTYQDSGYRRQKKCYVCNKPGCWSTRHTLQERKDAFARFRDTAMRAGTRHDTAYLQSFLTDIEGHEPLIEDDEEEVVDQLHDMEIEEHDEQYITEFGSIEGASLVAALNDQTTIHCLTKTNTFDQQAQIPLPLHSDVFSFDDRYSEHVFQGIMPDTGAAGVSTGGEAQVRALQRIDQSVHLNTLSAGEHTIRFGKGSAVSIGDIQVNTPLGLMKFCVLPTNTPFLLCIADMDKLGIRLDNLKNVLIQGNKHVPIVRKWGHPWLLLGNQGQNTNNLDVNYLSIACHLTEVELRQLHRRFGHPSAQRLLRLLQRAGQDVEKKAIDHLTKFCHHCQMNQGSPGRFKFSLKDDYDFNYSVIIDVLYLNNKPVLQVVDAATSFQAAKFLKDMSARNAWDTLRLCWIDVYLGPPDQVVHDAGKNFSSAEFRHNAKSMAIDVKEVPVEAHHSVGKVERYHAPLRRAFKIISNELNDKTSDEIILQMAVKAINDSAGPNGLIPTLLVFGAYPRMTNDSPPSPSVLQRAEAIYKAMKEVQRLHAQRQVTDALRMRNGPDMIHTLNLPLQSDVRVWREKDGWNGPFKLLAIDGHTCTIQMPYGPAQFRSTVVKPYYNEENKENDAHDDPDYLDDLAGNDPDFACPGVRNIEPISTEDPGSIPPAKRGRGRPKGSKNRIFISAKEESDLQLAKDLRAQGRITTPGAPFELSTKQEIDTLIARGVFEFGRYEANRGGRIFKSRIVNEIKGKATDAPYEKSRLVVQGYNDDGKEAILTQSPTIQRASQRLILAIAPSLMKSNASSTAMTLELRDISQAYVQSETHLNRLIFAYLPQPIRHMYPEGTIMRILKPLYGIAEAGTHWWATYSKHHKEKLSMITSTYDPCLLISTNDANKGAFGIVGLQTDDTLILGNKQFQNLEEQELKEAKFTAKPKQRLDVNSPLIFNGCILTLVSQENTLNVRQKDQGKKIEMIKKDNETKPVAQQYIEQRARGAYIASICQPEASFDLSIAAQHQQPEEEDIKALNKRLLWQANNLQRGLNYVPIDLSRAKLFVFVDGSFANNKDFSSQLGYVIVLANESKSDDDREETREDCTFTIRGNLIHWSSTKCKRVTRSVLASEIYGMVSGVDMSIATSTTLAIIMERLGMPAIPVIVCTDSFSLYECLVKLGTTKEKRLMIDIMALRQSYERRELFEIRWINGLDNPADAMTKTSPNQALTTLIDTNQLQIRVEGWVKRA